MSRLSQIRSMRKIQGLEPLGTLPIARGSFSGETSAHEKVDRPSPPAPTRRDRDPHRSATAQPQHVSAESVLWSVGDWVFFDRVVPSFTHGCHASPDFHLHPTRTGPDRAACPGSGLGGANDPDPRCRRTRSPASGSKASFPRPTGTGRPRASCGLCDTISLDISRDHSLPRSRPEARSR